MELSKYENFYKCVRDAKEAMVNVDEVVEIMRQHTEVPITPKEIGVLIFGEEYKKPVTTYNPYRYNSKKASQRAHLGQIMRHLNKYHCVKRVYVDGEPFIDEREEWVIDEDKRYDVPRMLKVWDDKGREFSIPNPDFDEFKARRAYHSGHYETVKKEVIPQVKAWIWVGD